MAGLQVSGSSQEKLRVFGGVEGGVLRFAEGSTQRLALTKYFMTTCSMRLWSGGPAD